MENDDLLTEIFLLLPVKTLIRFKSVSKKWRSLISSDYFCRRHTLLHPTPEPSLLLQTHVLQFFYMDDRTIYGGDEKRLIPYTLSDLPYHKIRHACNGLMLLESKVETTYDPITAELRRILKNSCYVYNPTTRKSREITLTHSDKYRYVEAMNLAFDPWKSPYYKIVCIRSTGPRVSPTDNPEHVYQIEVYDSERHSWKLSVEGLTSHNAAFHSNGVYWNDAVWWSCHGGHRCFDIGKGEVRTTSFPFRPHLGGWDHRNLYYIELVEEKDGSEHYHRIRLALGDRSFRGQRIDRDVVRFVDGDGSCGLMTCREGKGRKEYRYIDKSRYENVVDLGHEWFDPVQGFPFPHILAVV